MARALNINSEILQWARKTAGLSIEDAAERIGFSNSSRATAAEKLEALERGEEKPTRVQLLKIASVYRRPLTAFYMSTRPVAAERGEDFRSLSGPVPRQDAALLDALLRDIRARQDMARSILEDDEDARRLDFVGSMRVADGVPAVVRRIRMILRVDDDRGIRRGKNTPDDLFTELRARTEEARVFVLLAGNLGTHHTNISEHVFRGFAIADDLAPFIVINDQDAKAARSFTLIHELAHIVVGTTGISAAPSVAIARTPHDRIERFCNDVAGEFLLPRSVIPDIALIDDIAEAMELIAALADQWKVSEAMVAYRLWQMRSITRHAYSELTRIYSARWQRFREHNRVRAREDGNNGPSYYVVRKHRLGNALIGLVRRTLRANELTHTKAAKMLGVKPAAVEPLLASHGSRN
ncbi:ImmA/IrrE family metallo-endopeptidase [Methylocystis sp. H4A]|uniref:helix-turn-helix domain-containing protein n=1 Tax=Methylocystis sp. H4A TaxID=2785788 RepID=UPI0018C21C76|nr:XRE family transcriptional regulator [Methylocystis sp. H4A]MBG0801258.1 ImmA/IrrE family metallo-endopeptidase [Methylocystis sp. H4A]